MFSVLWGKQGRRTMARLYVNCVYNFIRPSQMVLPRGRITLQFHQRIGSLPRSSQHRLVSVFVFVLVILIGGRWRNVVVFICTSLTASGCLTSLVKDRNVLLSFQLIPPHPPFLSFEFYFICSGCKSFIKYVTCKYFLPVCDFSFT